MKTKVFIALVTFFALTVASPVVRSPLPDSEPPLALSDLPPSSRVNSTAVEDTPSPPAPAPAPPPPPAPPSPPSPPSDPPAPAPAPLPPAPPSPPLDPILPPIVPPPFPPLPPPMPLLTMVATESIRTPLQLPTKSSPGLTPSSNPSPAREPHLFDARSLSGDPSPLDPEPPRLGVYKLPPPPHTQSLEAHLDAIPSSPCCALLPTHTRSYGLASSTPIDQKHK
ncbi:hypothetical protein RSOLAG22IIIB_04407 [Rhizoctonia solani]|uniref:Uncharacterized protein n=1 Tax=Rhizoctonia solani TaxID=456999 RepID=A0A0K6FXM0_9AGAM|nr:hypothetical protein RSOLAG22IIIB_04407 [Rhizoctonia solani]